MKSVFDIDEKRTAADKLFQDINQTHVQMSVCLLSDSNHQQLETIKVWMFLKLI